VKLIDEVQSIDQWRTKVMEQSKPIILDCYADWCNPSKKVAKLLEKTTQEHDGKFKTVKLNIENCPQLSEGLNVKQIPAVFLIYRGSVVANVVGFNQ